MKYYIVDAFTDKLFNEKTDRRQQLPAARFFSTFFATQAADGI